MTHAPPQTPRRLFCGGIAALLVFLSPATFGQSSPIPLPEHPRPDFERADWRNLNGAWAFQFDPEDAGEKANWAAGVRPFEMTITVPFPWGSKLSGVTNRADLGWYARNIVVPEAWREKRVFVVVGACDWLTKGWLDGQPLGEHRGGYTPFEFELTPHVKWGVEQRLVLRVDDTKHAFKLEGKQGYGEAKGIWQTIYLEARPAMFIRSLHFTPDIDKELATVRATLSGKAPGGAALRLRFKTGGVGEVTQPVPADAESVSFDVPIPKPRLWTLGDPFLYELEAALAAPGSEDRVATYLGMRKISVMNLPGTDFPYIALNGRPVYLQMCLDQSYHPDGFYTFPSDAFMRDEILRSKRIGLNANRVHVKVEVPRKLYWADRLGLLIMADVPNSWGEPDAEMRREIEHALRGMIARDFNHPSIFSWVPFNETWGLFTGQGDKREYLPETQEWVASIYRMTKQLDPTRLVEDNSPCNYDHVETDINSWHAYLPGWEWRAHLDQVTRDTFPGSTWNFIGGRKQANQPLLNSECGNVWGYEGSTGDVDWSWDYHQMMNEFRRHPKVCGWLYTEHHDVINEWNGYWRYDRSDKFTGLEELVSGMTLNDLHSPFYVVAGDSLSQTVAPGASVELPLYVSFLTEAARGRTLALQTELFGWDTLGRRESYERGRRVLPLSGGWTTGSLNPGLTVKLPEKRGLAILALALEDEAGSVLHRNFTTFVIGDGSSPRDEMVALEQGRVRVLRLAPTSFREARWSQKQWNVLEGLKVNGAGHGYFEYRIAWPEGLSAGDVTGATFLVETSAKELFAKDREGATFRDVDYMRGEGVAHRSQNPNSYPMTDTEVFPSRVRVRVNGVTAGTFELPDDPADHRGILSWHAQLRDRKLREAGSYGWLLRATIPPEALSAAAGAKELVLRLEVDEAFPGGLAIYGERFGRYPLDPTVVFTLK